MVKLLPYRNLRIYPLIKDVEYLRIILKSFGKDKPVRFAYMNNCVSVVFIGAELIAKTYEHTNSA